MKAMENFKQTCPHDAFCGGCTYQGIPYERQLAEKEGEVRRLLESKGVYPESWLQSRGVPANMGIGTKWSIRSGTLKKMAN